MDCAADDHFNSKLDDSIDTQIFDEDEEMSKTSFFNTGKKGSEFTQAVSGTHLLFIMIIFYFVASWFYPTKFSDREKTQNCSLKAAPKFQNDSQFYCLQSLV